MDRQKIDVRVSQHDPSDKYFWGGSFFLAIVFAIIIISLAPGIFLSAILDNFIALNTKQVWGISIILSLCVFFFLRHRFKSGETALYLYGGLSFAFVVLMFLIHLLFSTTSTPFTSRTFYKMLGKEHLIKIEIKEAVDVSSKSIVGKWKADSAFMTFNEDGTLLFNWHKGQNMGDEDTGRWILKNGILTTKFEKHESVYTIIEFNNNKFSFQSPDGKIYDAVKVKK